VYVNVCVCPHGETAIQRQPRLAPMKVCESEMSYFRPTVLYCTVLYRTVPYRTVLYCTVLYRTVPYRTVPYRTVPYRTVPYRTVPYCTVLYCTVLYCTISMHRHPQHTAKNCGHKIVALCRVLIVYIRQKRRSQGSSIPASSSAGPKFKSCPGNRNPEFLVVALRLQLTRHYVSRAGSHPLHPFPIVTHHHPINLRCKDLGADSIFQDNP
jgi:hypothetical protein